MSVPVLNSLLDNLNQVLTNNHHLVADIRKSILELQQQLLALRDLMKDFPKYEQGRLDLDKRVEEIRKVVEEAEDAVETYLLEATLQTQKLRHLMSKAFHRKTHRDVGKQIEDIGERIKEMIQVLSEETKRQGEKAKDGFEVPRHRTLVNLHRAANSREAPKDMEDRVIGLDGAVEELKGRITRGSECLEVITIFGMLGLGKTTLAKKLYKDPDIGCEYMIRAFVCVSIEYDIKEVLKTILASFTLITDDEVARMTTDELKERLYLQLKGRQYMVVLVDVWEMQFWEELKVAFPHDKRCRILITSRYEKVAAHVMSGTGYLLEFLNRRESRELLRWKIFQQDYCPKELQVYEEKIVEACGGLPLALLMAASIIVNHPHKVDWWKYVAGSLWDYIARDHGDRKVVNLMYKHLPNHLKPCFLYVGVFPRNFEIPKWKLVRLWISEGFIQQENSFELEDIAEQYLQELVFRHLVMIEQWGSNDKIKTCRLDNTLHEFCKYEAANGNLFGEMQGRQFLLSGKPTLDQYRRLCINSPDLIRYYLSETPSFECVRSFLSFGKEVEFLDIHEGQKLVVRNLKSLNLVKVLDIQKFLFLTRFPSDLCSLVLLKYVAIDSNCASLPLSLSALWNLQTLIVHTTSPTLQIIADICTIPQFRHLHTNSSTSLRSAPTVKSNKSTEDTLSNRNVQTLCTISPESCRKELFDRTPKLKKLGIRGSLVKLFVVEGDSSLFSYLSKLEFLENLKLLNEDMRGKLNSLPPLNSFPKQLTKLTLLNTFLDWKEMRTLGELENLEVLKLKENAFQGRRWQTRNGGFNRLKHLQIGHTDLVLWEASAENFPKLKSLKLNSCQELRALPHGLAEIPSLRSVTLHCTNPQVASSARRIHVLKVEQSKVVKKTNNFTLSVFPPEH